MEFAGNPIMKMKTIFHLLGWKPKVREYGFELNRFHLADEGDVEYAQWLHPKDTKKQILQADVDQLKSFLVACGGILACMTVAFGSLRIGILSLFPNVFPVAIVMGVLGWSGVRVNIGTAMITSVSMGLTVDSTIRPAPDCGGEDGCIERTVAHPFKPSSSSSI